MRVIGQNVKPITEHAIHTIWRKTLIFFPNGMGVNSILKMLKHTIVMIFKIYKMMLINI